MVNEPFWFTHLLYPSSSLSSAAPVNPNMIEAQNLIQVTSVVWDNNVFFSYSTISRPGLFFLKVCSETGRGLYNIF